MPVTPSQALDAVHEAGKTGRFDVSTHAKEEAAECSATRYDIQEALRTATTAIHQAGRDRWRIEGGKDLDGDDLTVVVVFEGDVVVITVF